MCTTSEAPFESSVHFYYTSSLSETSSFWEEVVGLPLVLDQGTCRIYRISPDGYLGFCEKEGMSTAKDGMIITLVTEKVDEVVAKLGARGLVLEKEPVFNPTFNIYHAFFATRMVSLSKSSDSKILSGPSLIRGSHVRNPFLSP